jgi:hypothetical protein
MKAVQTVTILWPDADRQLGLVRRRPCPRWIVRMGPTSTRRRRALRGVPTTAKANSSSMSIFFGCPGVYAPSATACVMPFTETGCFGGDRGNAQGKVAKIFRAGPGSQRPDWLAGHVRLDLRNVAAKYPFERSHGFPGIQPNSGRRGYLRLSCGAGETQLGPNARISAGMLARGSVDR